MALGLTPEYDQLIPAFFVYSEFEKMVLLTTVQGHCHHVHEKCEQCGASECDSDFAGYLHLVPETHDQNEVLRPQRCSFEDSVQTQSHDRADLWGGRWMRRLLLGE